MKPSHYIGIDPGRNGAIGMISASGETAKTWEIPYRKRGETWEIDLAGLIDRLQQIKKLPRVAIALEWPGAWPGTFGNVARDAMVFGKGLGQIDAVLHCLDFGHTRVTPQAWKGRLGLVGKSWDAKSTQGQLLWGQAYPRHAGVVLGPKGGLLDGPLDSLLIAHYLRVEGESQVGYHGKRRPKVLGMGDRPELQEWWNNLSLTPKDS